MTPIITRLTLGLIAAAALTSSVSAQDTLKLAVGQRGLWDTSISDVGQRAGIFKKHGLTLELLYTQGAGETQQAVISGSVEIGVGVGSMGVLSAYSKYAPVRIMGAEIKGFPAGYPSHTGIEAALELHPQIKSAADIKAIRLFTGPSGMGYASEEACWHPETRERADHSHPFLLSLALTEGSVEVRQLDPRGQAAARQARDEVAPRRLEREKDPLVERLEGDLGPTRGDPGVETPPRLAGDAPDGEPGL